MISWPPISDFANLEELHIDVQGADELLPHVLLRSVVPPCLRRVIIGVGTETARWAFLDSENLANLVKGHKSYRELVLQISAKADPEKVRGLLPQAAQAGVLEGQILHEYSVLSTQ
jgi:hypothetical protein